MLLDVATEPLKSITQTVVADFASWNGDARRWTRARPRRNRLRLGKGGLQDSDFRDRLKAKMSVNALDQLRNLVLQFQRPWPFGAQLQGGSLCTMPRLLLI